MHSEYETLAVQLLSAQKAKRNDRVRIYLLAQAARCLNFFQAVKVLVDAELVSPAAVCLRSLKEQVFVMEALVKEGGRYNALMKTDDHARRQNLARLRDVPVADRADHLTDEALDEYLSDSPERGVKFNAFQWAQWAGRVTEYKTGYALLSSHVHASVAAVEDHVDWDKSGIRQIRGKAPMKEAAFFVVDACDVLETALTCVVDDRSPSKEQQTVVERLHEEKSVLLQIMLDDL